ncbi:hypothetical protein V8E36_007218 [Tilletia maclaganii]
MQVTLSLTTVLFSLASSVVASSHRMPLGAGYNHHALSKRAPTLTPTAPGPGDVYRAGSDIPIQWDPDTSGSNKWKQTTIRLMTGSNLNMSQLAVVGVIDGTDASTTELKWTAPEVDPYSAIYFFQFDHGGQAQKDPTWTTRFTIASPSGQTVPPPFSRQPENLDNPPIPYGNGALASGPSSSSGGSSDSEGSSTAASSSSSTTDAETATSSAPTSSSSSPSRSTASSSSSSSPSSTSGNTGAAAPALLHHPAGMALIGGAIGVAAIFIL